MAGRSELKRRVEVLETDVQQLKTDVWFLDKKIGKFVKITEYVIEGSDALEQLFQDKVETHGNGGHVAFKKELNMELRKEFLDAFNADQQE